MEWFILVLLVPAVVVPVVLLWGFAGCHLVFKLEAPVPVPELLEATPISVSEISLNWISSGVGLLFEIQRAADAGPFEVIGTVSNPPFIDPPNFGDPAPLQPGVTYHYQVFAIEGDERSLGSNIADARPLAFQFDLSQASGGVQNRAGDTIVQRLSASLLKNSGQVVRIHLRGTTTDTLVIDGIYMSRVAPAGDAYDSDADLTMLAAGVTILANASQAVDVVNPYVIPDPLQDLLIAFDINATQGRVHFDQLPGALSFTLDAQQQGSLADRSPNATDTATYNMNQDRLYLIEKIEVL